MSEIKKMSVLDAFRALDDVQDEEILTKEEIQNLTEAKEFSTHNSIDMENAEEFNNDPEGKIQEGDLEVIDADADTVEHLKAHDEYVGQYLLRCKACRNTRFMDGDKLNSTVLENETEERYNVDDECPFCHAIGKGYELIGLVGKAPEESEVKMDNDSLTGNDVKFENDEVAVEETPIEEPTEEPTEESEDIGFELPETPYDETTALDDTSDMEVPQLGDEVTDEIKLDDTEEEDSLTDDEHDEFMDVELDDEEEKKKDEALEEDIGEEAMKCVKFISSDIPTKDHDLFGQFDLEYHEIKPIDDKNGYAYYAQYEATGKESEINKFVNAYNLDVEYSELPAIAPEDIKDVVTEDVAPQDAEQVEPISFNQFSSIVIEPENIQNVTIYDLDKDDIDPIFEGKFEDIPESLFNATFVGFNTKDGRLHVNVDITERDDNNLRKALNLFNDDFNEKIDIWDIATGDNVLSGTKETCVNDYGDSKFVSFEAPEDIQINLRGVTVVEGLTESINEELDLSHPEDRLIYDILVENGMSNYKVDRVGTPEYWIAECIRNKEDLDVIYKNYIWNKTPELIHEFKEVTGYKDAIEAKFEEEPEEISDVNEDEIIEKAKDKLRNEKLFAVIYGYSDNGKFVPLDDMMGLTSFRELQFARELLERRHNFNGTIRAVYATSIEETIDLKKDADLKSCIKECEDNHWEYTVEKSLVEGYKYRLTRTVIKESFIETEPEVTEELEKPTSEPVNEEVQEEVTQEPVVEEVQNKTFACYFRDKYIGDVEAANEQEAYTKMEQTWPENPYGEYDGIGFVVEVEPEEQEPANENLNENTELLLAPEEGKVELVPVQVSEPEANEEKTEEVTFTPDEVKEVATEVVSEVVGPDENKTEEEQAADIQAAVETKVDAAVEEKIEQTNEEQSEPNEEEVEFDEKAFENFMNEWYDNNSEETKLFECTSGYINDNNEIVLEGFVHMAEGKDEPTSFVLKQNLSEDNSDKISYTVTSESLIESIIYTK